MLDLLLELTFPCWLYLITFIGYPILALKIYFTSKLDYICTKLLYVIPFLMICDVLYWFDISFKGDYFDYLVLSIHYLVFSFLVIWTYNSENVYKKAFHILGKLLLIFNLTIIGMLGFIMFLITTQELESDRLYNFNDRSNNYQTRRYSSGFVTQIDIYYRFETYQQFPIIIFEKKIDDTNFKSTETKLNFEKEGFNIQIEEVNQEDVLVFKSSNGEVFRKKLN